MQCQFCYNRAKEKGVNVNLTTFLVASLYLSLPLSPILQNAMLRPDDVQAIMKKVQKKKVNFIIF